MQPFCGFLCLTLVLWCIGCSFIAPLGQCCSFYGGTTKWSSSSNCQLPSSENGSSAATTWCFCRRLGSSAYALRDAWGHSLSSHARHPPQWHRQSLRWKPRSSRTTYHHYVSTKAGVRYSKFRWFLFLWPAFIGENKSFYHVLFHYMVWTRIALNSISHCYFWAFLFLKGAKVLSKRNPRSLNHSSILIS